MPFSEHPFLQELKAKMEKYTATIADEKVYIQCDKTLYEAGETIWFAVYVREATTLKVGGSELITVKLFNPDGSELKNLKLFVWQGKAIGQFDLAANEKGGSYKIEAQTNWQLNTATKYVREITVQKAILPQVDISLDFERATYGAGEMAMAAATIRDFENKPLQNLDIEVEFVKRYSNGTNQIDRQRMTTDAAGQLQIKYKIPKNIITEDVRLVLSFYYKGSPQGKAFPLPIVLYAEYIDLQFFAESTDKLIPDIENRVAFKALGEYGGAMDIEGEIVNAAGVVQTTFSSYYKGMGQLKFTPKAGESYFAQITAPVQTKNRYPLPIVSATTYSVFVAAQSKKNQSELNIQVYSPQADTLFFVAQQNGLMVYSESIAAKAGINSLKIDSRNWRIGLATLTLFDATQKPVAERLVFCNQDKQLNISLKTDKEKFGIREKVNLQITVKDQDGQPVQGDFSLAVADDKQLGLHNDQQAHILASLLLEQQQIKGKIDAPNFYFDRLSDKNRKLPAIDRRQALDYLLLTQGWRKLSWAAVSGNKAPTANYTYQKIKMPNLRGKVVNPLYTTTDTMLVVLEVADSRCSTYTNSDGDFSFANIDWRKNIRIIIPQTKKFEAIAVNVKDTTIQKLALAFRPYTAAECSANRLACEEQKTNIIRANNMKANQRDWSGRDKSSDIITIAVANSLDFVLSNAINDSRTKRAKSAAPPPVVTKKPLAAKEADLSNMKAALAEVRAKNTSPIEPQKNINWLNVHREFYVPRYEAVSDTAEIIRYDFRKTIFWSPSIRTNSEGVANISFYQSDDISQYRITIEGIGDGGELGRAEHKYFSIMPLVLSAQFPAELVVGDTMLIALTVSNNTDIDLLGAMQIVLPPHLRLLSADSFPPLLAVSAQNSRLLRLPILVMAEAKAADVILLISSTTYKDRLVCSVSSRLGGFPVQLTFPVDSLEKDIYFDLSQAKAGTSTAELLIFPNMLSQIFAASKDMAQMPSGCFEQVTSSNYPNIFAMQLLQLNSQKDTQQLNKIADYLNVGYQKLAAYECADGGFDWYGQSPANEALTAYGLMQFVDMQKLQTIDKPIIDKQMMSRTHNWLLSKRDGKGGWENKSTHQYSWGKSRKDLLNTYIVWAMTEANYGETIQQEIDHAHTHALKSKDPYILALVANALLNQKDERARNILQILLKTQNIDGSFIGKDCSMTGSTGDAFRIETTALVALALQKTADNPIKLSQLIHLLQKSRTYSGFGNSQSNALTLKVFTNYAKANNKTLKSLISLELDGLKLGQYEMSSDRTEPLLIKLPLLSQQAHRLKIKQSGSTQPLACLAKVHYYTNTPPSQPECVLSFSSQFERTDVALSKEIRLTTTLENTSKEIQPMAILQIGIPAGLSLSIEQLQQLQRESRFDFYELFNGQLVLHFRQLGGKERRQINLDLKADVAGHYEAPPSCAYLYYTNEFRFWQPANSVVVL